MQMHAEEAREFIDEFGDLIYEMPFQAPENLICWGAAWQSFRGCARGWTRSSIWESVGPYTAKLIEVEGGGKWKLILDEVLNMARCCRRCR